MHPHAVAVKADCQVKVHAFGVAVRCYKLQLADAYFNSFRCGILLNVLCNKIRERYLGALFQVNDGLLAITGSK